MANIITPPSFFPRRLSEYVPALQYVADATMNDGARVSYGAPGLASATYYLSAQSINAAVVVPASSVLNSATADSPYGRNVTLVLSGAGTGNCVVDGWDYLGQPMSETIAYNGTTTVNGKKAFMRIRQFTLDLVASTTINIGTGTQHGIPYKAIKVLSEESNGTPATLGTLTSPVLTDPQTATTGDPRGTYAFNTTLDGSKVLTVGFSFANDVNSSGNGGYHGIAHFSN